MIWLTGDAKLYNEDDSKFIRRCAVLLSKLSLQVDMLPKKLTLKPPPPCTFDGWPNLVKLNGYPFSAGRQVMDEARKSELVRKMTQHPIRDGIERLSAAVELTVELMADSLQESQ